MKGIILFTFYFLLLLLILKRLPVDKLQEADNLKCGTPLLASHINES
jgi:hypothetical protein